MVRKGKRKGSAAEIQNKPFVQAQINPFNKKAYGCKVPDFNSSPSSTFYAYDTVTPATSTTNAACLAFMPNLQSTIVTATGSAADTWAWAASYGGTTASSQATALAAQYGLYRPVAHGVRVTCSQTTDTATGFIHIAMYGPSNSPGTTWQLPTTLTQLANCQNYLKLPINSFINNPISVVNRFMDASAFQYQDPATTITDTSASTSLRTSYGGWSVILIAISGQASGTSPIQVEAIMHGEGQSLFSGQQRDTPAAKADNILLEAVSEAQGSTSPMFHSPTQDTPPTRSREWTNLLSEALFTVADELLEEYYPTYSKPMRAVARGARRYAKKRGYTRKPAARPKRVRRIRKK